MELIFNVFSRVWSTLCDRSEGSSELRGVFVSSRSCEMWLIVALPLTQDISGAEAWPNLAQEIVL